VVGYSDGDCVPFRIELKGSSFEANSVYHERIVFDKFKDINPLDGVPGIVGLENFVLGDRSSTDVVVNPYQAGSD